MKALGLPLAYPIWIGDVTFSIAARMESVRTGAGPYNVMSPYYIRPWDIIGSILNRLDPLNLTESGA